MPKESKTPKSIHASGYAPYPTASTAGVRVAGNWSSADDDVLMQARASGLNWQPIANKYFPNKSANACRKRHERLIEQRHVEDWSPQRLELLAQEYMAARKEMWEILASRLGDKWNVVEAKCLEKGFKTLQRTARIAQKKAESGPADSFDEQGTSDHNSDSGIGLGSDAEMGVDEPEPEPSRIGPLKPSTWHAHTGVQSTHHDHSRTRSLPQILPNQSLSQPKFRQLPQLPLYQPPPPITTHSRAFDGPMTASPVTTSPATMSFLRSATFHRTPPDSQYSRGAISIQSIVSPAEPQRV